MTDKADNTDEILIEQMDEEEAASEGEGRLEGVFLATVLFSGEPPLEHILKHLAKEWPDLKVTNRGDASMAGSSDSVSFETQESSVATVIAGPHGPDDAPWMVDAAARTVPPYPQAQAALAQSQSQLMLFFVSNRQDDLFDIARQFLIVLSACAKEKTALLVHLPPGVYDPQVVHTTLNKRALKAKKLDPTFLIGLTQAQDASGKTIFVTYGARRFYSPELHFMDMDVGEASDLCEMIGACSMYSHFPEKNGFAVLPQNGRIVKFVKTETDVKGKPIIQVFGHSGDEIKDFLFLEC